MRNLASMIALSTRNSRELSVELCSYEGDSRERVLELQVKAAEEKLARAEEDLARVLQVSHSFIYETDEDLWVTLINGDVREILGVAPAELIGKKLDEFIRIDDGLANDGHATEHLTFRNLVCRTRDGTRHIQISGKPLRDEDGRFCGAHAQTKTVIKYAISDPDGMTPAAQALKIFQFSIVAILTITLGMIHPPVGLCLFVCCKIGDVSIFAVTRQIIPFFLVLVVVVALLIAFPPVPLRPVRLLD
jgi:PAS domain S-box-containing protein